ncbi:MAG: RsmE family RNA methyltransferase [Bryobacteraceae bacterium]|jgi:16S rRNA (uracil1498-N3)-methyltransferase
MARRRFFVDALRNGLAELHGEDARHLTRVLRVEPGQQYEISDNHAAYLAEIAEARGERVVFRIIEPLPAPNPQAPITLLASIVKFDRFEWIVEKSTELGVERIVPVAATRTEKGLFDASVKRTERWLRIARESSQQSRRVRMPAILPAVRFERAIAETAEYRCFLDEGFPDEAQAPPLLATLPTERTAADRIAVLLGPEGGWTDAERQLAIAAGWRAASLGPNILRTETAAVAALAILANAWMV